MGMLYIPHRLTVTALPPGGDRSLNACLVLADRYRKTSMFLPCHEDEKTMGTAIMIWNSIISHTGSIQKIISDRYPKFTSALWKNLHSSFGKNLSFSTAYHPQTDGLAERMIQNLEHMIRRFCAYGLEFKDSDGFTHDWCTLIPVLALADLVDINPTARSFKIMLEKARHHAKIFMEDSFKYAKERWDKSHKPPDFEVGDLVLVSTLRLNKIEFTKKLKYSFAGPFMIRALHGPNSVQL
ncbi:hypothetical protein O181_111056 [Austropuccinia psidii MF-1]|uniref:Integrase catalytic domain-containing protein n=1 Tax=Austropuccinia psidii MF-1 TaxID=1389203 RepID=A0A9Q3PSC8_9BASI|nr:hypothetical protein [Austropuccinia psidii MF-1]